jgi:hypothetical protein
LAGGGKATVEDVDDDALLRYPCPGSVTSNTRNRARAITPAATQVH